MWLKPRAKPVGIGLTLPDLCAPLHRPIAKPVRPELWTLAKFLYYYMKFRKTLSIFACW